MITALRTYLTRRRLIRFAMRRFDMPRRRAEIYVDAVMESYRLMGGRL